MNGVPIITNLVHISKEAKHFLPKQFSLPAGDNQKQEE